MQKVYETKQEAQDTINAIHAGIMELVKKHPISVLVYMAAADCQEEGVASVAAVGLVGDENVDEVSVLLYGAKKVSGLDWPEFGVRVQSIVDTFKESGV